MSILTVTAPAADRRLTTLAAVKQELGISDAASDSALEAHIVAASAAAETYCKRVFAVEGVSESIRLRTRDEAILLRRYPVTAIASVSIAGEALDADEWEADLASGLLWRLSGDARTTWPCRQAIAVDYTTGYATIPADVAKAVIMLVAGYRAGAGRDPTVRSETVDGVRSVSYALAGAAGGDGSLPPPVARLLDPYVMRMLP